MATVIVFADSDEVGRSRASRFIAKQNWQIKRFLKVLFMGDRQVENLDDELTKVYKKAEKFGIGVCFDSWSAPPKRER